MPASGRCKTLFDRQHSGREQTAQQLIAGASNAKAVLVAARVTNGALDEKALRLLELGSLSADGGRGGERRCAQSCLRDGDRPAGRGDGSRRDDGLGGRGLVGAWTVIARPPRRGPRQSGSECC